MAFVKLPWTVVSCGVPSAVLAEHVTLTGNNHFKTFTSTFLLFFVLHASSFNVVCNSTTGSQTGLVGARGFASCPLSDKICLTPPTLECLKTISAELNDIVLLKLS